MIRFPFARSLCALLALWSSAAIAQQGQAAPSAPVSPVSLASILQMALGLAVVLAFVAVAAWVLKKFTYHQGGAQGTMKIVGAAPVGQRERLVLVEIGSTWLVVGVAPGSVNALHSMPKDEGASLAGGEPDAGKGFPAWLRKATARGKGG